MGLLDSLEFTFDKADSHFVFIGKSPFQHRVDIRLLDLQDVVFGLAVLLSGVVDLFPQINQ